MAESQAKYLLLISLGPIQDFIATARRCQDLWYGSWLLSELAKDLTIKLRKKFSIDTTAVILPATDINPNTEQDKKPNIANKIYAVVSASSQNELTGKMDELQNDMICHLQELAKKEFSTLSNNAREYFDEQRALAQLAELMEFFWVAVEYDDNDYDKARSQVDKAMAARKNTREFSKIKWSQTIQNTDNFGLYKSSLDGARESVIDEEVYKKYKDNPAKLYELFKIRPNEPLCGIGLMKRLGTERDSALQRVNKPRFHSTAHIAAMPILTYLAGKDLPNSVSTALKDYFDELNASLSDDALLNIANALGKNINNGQLGYDGSVLFEDRLKSLLDNYGRPKESSVELKKSLRKLLNAINCPVPCPYYVFLKADGDKMGKAISLQKTIQEQKTLGKALDDFSLECENIVRNHNGSLIYAGGDDVMAMLPLDTALDCANKLREKFKDKLDGQKLNLKFIDKNKELQQPSLSVGLVIAHFLEPLQNVRKLADEAERTAKDKAGRNALAIIMSKRSGADIAAYGRWLDDNGSADNNLYNRIKTWQKQLLDKDKKNRIYVSLALALEEALVPFEAEFSATNEQSKISHDDRDFYEAIINDTLHGKQISKEKAHDIIRQIFEDATADYRKQNDGKIDYLKIIHNVSNEIQIAHMLNQAFGAKEVSND